MISDSRYDALKANFLTAIDASVNQHKALNLGQFKNRQEALQRLDYIDALDASAQLFKDICKSLEEEPKQETVSFNSPSVTDADIIEEVA